MASNKEKEIEKNSEAKDNIIAKRKDLQKIQNKKKKRKIIFTSIAIVAVIALLFNPKSGAKVKNEFNYEEVTADIGNIDVTVEGKGTVVPNSQYDIYASVTGEILEDNVEVGKIVNKNDLLYVIDSEDLDVTLNRAQLAVNQSQLNYNNVQNQVTDLKILANANGTVENLAISKGSYVTNSMEICKIVDVGKYELKLQFLCSGASLITVGNQAEIEFVDYLTKATGTVKNISDGQIMLSTGAQVVEVTIEAETTGYSLAGAMANAEICLNNGTKIKSVNSAPFEKIGVNMVRAQSFGTVEEVCVENGSNVKVGDVIAVLSSRDLQNSYTSAGISLNDAKLSLSNAKKQLDNYNITSPITGKVVYKNSKLGDNLSIYSVTNSNVMATIADTSIMKFEMAVDELEISKVKVGQKVKIVIEALDNNEYEGTVTSINTIGKTVGGITTYSVLVEMEGKDEIYSGMNVDADIEVSSAQNVLRVPLEAVRKGNVVYMKVNDPTFQDEDTSVPMGYKKVEVEIGQNNDKYVEIISGVKEGDILLIDKVTQSGVFDMRNMMQHGM